MTTSLLSHYFPDKLANVTILTHDTKLARVKAHNRRVYFREYFFICEECKQPVTRQTYATIRPSFCECCVDKREQRRREKNKIERARNKK